MVSVAVMTLVACSRTIVPTETENACRVILTQQTPGEAGWTGLSEAELLEAVQAFEPGVVYWDRMTHNESSADIAVRWERTTRPASVVERDADSSSRRCRPGPELELEADFDIVLGNGEVTAAFTGAFSVDQAGDVFVFGQGVPTMADDWVVAGGGPPPSGSPDESARWVLTFLDRWEDADIGIDLLSDVGGWSKSAWSGHWTE